MLSLEVTLEKSTYNWPCEKHSTLDLDYQNKNVF